MVLDPPSPFDMDGKVAIVTGSGRGLGKAMAKALAAAGAQVVCAARTPEQIEQTVAEITSDGGTAIAVPTDVTSSAAVDALVARAVEAYGRLDVMIANAGGGGGPQNLEFWEYPDDAFESVVATNLKSAFYSDRAAARQFVAQGEGGVIVNVASGTALRGNQQFAYPTAKGGVISLTKSAATMLAKHDIRVNAIVPGYINQRPPRDEQEAEVRRNRGVRVPVRRLGDWWELGPLALYLASDASRYVTGELFIIDGGGLAGGLAPVTFAPAHEIGAAS
ncbi:MAG: SDR family oxidoreductase [Dehalococcoidia bacterium]|nr:SDR family oxidoreductase [Dehalococcoidia bacterium]